MPTMALDGQSPDEVWFGTPQQIDHLQYVISGKPPNVHKQVTWKKLDDKASETEFATAVLSTQH